MDAALGGSEDVTSGDRRLGRRIRSVLARNLARIPFAEDVIAAWHCAIDPKTPRAVRLTLLGALAYFVLPVDAIPDILMPAGFVDDASVIAIAITTVGAHLNARHRQLARAALARLRGDG